MDPGDSAVCNGIGATVWVRHSGLLERALVVAVSTGYSIRARLNPKKRVLDDRFLFFQLLTLKRQTYWFLIGATQISKHYRS